jgi:hypothetical protein
MQGNFNKLPIFIKLITNFIEAEIIYCQEQPGSQQSDNSTHPVSPARRPENNEGQKNEEKEQYEREIKE